MVATVMSEADAARATVVDMLLGAVHGMPFLSARWLPSLPGGVEVAVSLKSLEAVDMCAVMSSGELLVTDSNYRNEIRAARCGNRPLDHRKGDDGFNEILSIKSIF